MKKGLTAFIALAVTTVILGAASAGEDIAKFPSCELCGMDRNQYGYSRAVVECADGANVGTCSINCAEKAAAQKGNLKGIKVADYNTRELLDADKAFWVMGGNKKGVMTMRPKWAFGAQEGAKAFMAENGGSLATYEEVKQAVREEIQARTGHHSNAKTAKKCCENCNKQGDKK